MSTAPDPRVSPANQMAFRLFQQNESDAPRSRALESIDGARFCNTDTGVERFHQKSTWGSYQEGTPRRPVCGFNPQTTYYHFELINTIDHPAFGKGVIHRWV